MAHLLELFNGTLVDTTTFVDKVAGLESDKEISRSAHGQRRFRAAASEELTVVDLPESTWLLEVSRVSSRQSKRRQSHLGRCMVQNNLQTALPRRWCRGGEMEQSVAVDVPDNDDVDVSFLFLPTHAHLG